MHDFLDSDWAKALALLAAIYSIFQLGGSVWKLRAYRTKFYDWLSKRSQQAARKRAIKVAAEFQRMLYYLENSRAATAYGQYLLMWTIMEGTMIVLFIGFAILEQREVWALGIYVVFMICFIVFTTEWEKRIAYFAAMAHFGEYASRVMGTITSASMTLYPGDISKSEEFVRRCMGDEQRYIAEINKYFREPR